MATMFTAIQKELVRGMSSNTGCLP